MPIKMPSSRQSCKPPLFRLPVEVRLMIYRHAWKVDPKFHTIKRTRQLKHSFLKEQLLAIGRLGAICQLIRTEAFNEYFHHAQAYLRWDKDGTGSRSLHNKYYAILISSSPLLLAHLRHVSVYWTDELRSDGFTVSFQESLFWLRSLKQLKTLEIVFPVPSDIWWLGVWYTEKRYMNLQNLRGLEKVTIKYDFADLSQSDAERFLAELNTDQDFLHFKRFIEKLVTLPKVPLFLSSLCLFLYPVTYCT